MPEWARGTVWDCSDPTDCRPVQRSSRSTKFAGERQLDRAALRRAAEVLDWQDHDIVAQAGEGGVEVRSDCELLTVLAFHHPGLAAQAPAASAAVDTDLREGWVAPPVRHLPFVPCRLQPRDVVLQDRQRLVDDGTGGSRLEHYSKPR
eukprot:4012245-Pleurochrysis_carterae.AAC.1